MHYLQRITPNHLLMIPSLILSLLLFPLASFASIYDQELLKLTNAERAKYDIPALTLSSKLGEAAQKHAVDMAEHNYFSHTGRNGSKGSERVNDEGYEYSRRGENIAAGHEEPDVTMSKWMNSKGHRANILNAKYTEIGFGYAADDSSKYNYYWVQVFATPKEGSSNGDGTDGDGTDGDGTDGDGTDGDGTDGDGTDGDGTDGDGTDGDGTDGDGTDGDGTDSNTPDQSGVELEDKAVALFNAMEIILEEYIQHNPETESNGEGVYYRLYDNIYGLGVYKDGFYIGVNNHGQWDWNYIATLDKINKNYCAEQCW
ncbi:CAP domain-containing protein [Candidatus Albibeggiatoa sp. nov. BB20]|uniref:CAP domain-containing protein n=1 Tax=Candidatus Albibeggiatoa sp. nov. BB20 TaxID=3162723 RepID=UPI003365621D